MGKREFIIERYSIWEETESLLKKIRVHGIRSLSDEELLRLGTLYRQASSDLAKSRAAEPFGDVTAYLNRLVSETHAVIYVDRGKPFRGFLRFIKTEFPELVRGNSIAVLISALIFLLPMILGYYWMNSEPDWMQRFFPYINLTLEQMSSSLESGPSMLASGNITEESMPQLSSFIMFNNIRVAIFAFTAGITFGIGTIYSLVMNGVLLGGVANLYFIRPNEFVLYFLAGVLPHGVLEIPAIILSGAAGLLLAQGLILPGNLTRVEALQLRGRYAIRIMYGVVIMLVIAGIIEGFITPMKYAANQNFLDWIKIFFALILAILMVIYFTFAGRGKLPA